MVNNWLINARLYSKIVYIEKWNIILITKDSPRNKTVWNNVSNCLQQMPNQQNTNLIGITSELEIGGIMTIIEFVKTSLKLQ